MGHNNGWADRNEKQKSRQDTKEGKRDGKGSRERKTATKQ